MTAHGTVSGYIHDGCRCDLCRDARRTRRRELRQEKLAAPPSLADVKECVACGKSYRRAPDTSSKQWAGIRWCSRSCRSRAARLSRTDKSPHSVRDRPLLARTCRACGLLLSGSAFTLDGRDGRRDHKCTACRHRAYNKTATESARQKMRDRTAAFVASEQRRTLDAANRHGYVWTGPELEFLATRPELTTAEQALALGRSYAAVAHKRRALRVPIPNAVYLAGASIRPTG